MANVIEIIQNAYAALRAGRAQQAVEDLQRSLRLHTDNPDLHEHLGLILSQLGQADQALYHLQRATVFAPSHADFHANLATVLNLNGKTKEAVESYKRALMFNAASFPAQLGLSSALFGLSEYDAAAEAAKQASQLNPRAAEPWVNLGLALTRSGRTAEGVKAFRDGVERTGEHALLLMNLAMAMNYRPESAAKELFEVHERLGRALSVGSGSPLMPDMNPDRVLRVGYLCPDFPDRAAAWFLKPILAAHDRERFEITCYSTRPPGETDLAGLGPMARWVDGGNMFDPMLADTIRRDGIDVLVCLCSYGPMSRLPLLARRAAPVQIAYLGCPGTTGIRAIGARIADSITDGPDVLSTEKVVRVDGCSMAYAAPQDAPDVTTRGGSDVVFGCFGAAQKITEPVAEAWGAILKQTPGSTLLLKNGAFDAPITRKNYLQMLADRGIPAERVTIEGATPAFRDHLSAYGRVDVALDTFPYNGMATTCEAMWMGVPVVSMTGAMHAGRMGLSLLTAAGLPEFAAESPEGYVKAAVALAKDGKRRAELRGSLRDRLKASKLCDGKPLTRQLEETYRRLWREWCGNVFYPVPAGGLPPDVG